MLKRVQHDVVLTKGEQLHDVGIVLAPSHT